MITRARFSQTTQARLALIEWWLPELLAAAAALATALLFLTAWPLLLVLALAVRIRIGIATNNRQNAAAIAARELVDEPADEDQADEPVEATAEVVR